MTTVERVKSICKERKIAISKLETSCGFSNGYIRSLKKGVIPDDRIEVIANFLRVSIEFLLTGKEDGEKYSAKYARLVSFLRNDPDMEDLLIKYYNLSEKKRSTAFSAFKMIIGGAEWREK